jgi:hypothetical protein
VINFHGERRSCQYTVFVCISF